MNSYSRFLRTVGVLVLMLLPTMAASASEVPFNRVSTAAVAPVPMTRSTLSSRVASTNRHLFETFDHVGSVEQMQPAPAYVLRRSFSSMRMDQIYDAVTMTARDTVMFNLFHDKLVTATMTGFESRGVDNFTWSGRPDHDAYGTVVLTELNGEVSGVVFADGQIFRVMGTASGVYEITEVDPGAFAPEHGEADGPDRLLSVTRLETEFSPAVPGPTPTVDPAIFGTLRDKLSGELRAMVGKLDLLAPTTIRIAVVATANAISASPSIQADVQLAIDLLNQALANSHVDIVFELAAAMLIDYQESGSGNLALEAEDLAGKTDGYMDEIHVARDIWHADLVTLLVDNKADGNCGIGYIIDNPETMPDPSAFGFSVVNIHCMISNLSLAHEVGHNLGGRHDRYIDNSGGFNHGYIIGNINRRTIMAYGDQCEAMGLTPACPKIPHFSNPNVGYGETFFATGVPVEDPQSADNRREFNINRHRVGNFRQ
jgi:hypothetical protein